MTQKPVSFDGNDLTVVTAGNLDPSVLPATVVLSDGSVPFVAAQGGVTAGGDPAKLATLGDVIANSASVVWQAPVLDIVSSLPGSPSLGDRYILISTQQINQWSGSAWVTSAGAAGWTTWAVAQGAYYEFATGSSTWVDASVSIDHEQLKNLAGGTTGEHNHLANAQAAQLTASQAAHKVIAAPTGGAGVVSARLLDGSDIQTGQVIPAQGGTGVDSSAASGYPLLTAGTWAFSATIPWAALTSVPSSFTPAAHASTHESGGSDQLDLDASQIGSGQLATVQGGTGIDGSALGARLALISPGAGGALAARALTPDDVSGASAPGQVITRNSGNTANIWSVPTSSYPMIVNNGVPVAAEANLNFIGATSITDSPGTHSVIIDVTSGGGTVSMDPIVAALLFG